MKKVIRVEDLCCKRCANRAACKLELVDGVISAKGNYRKNVILVENEARVTDEMLRSTVEQAGFTVLAVEERRGLFY
ncbi:MAG: heavy-metal-associated domain-containing protein [Clostridia bacterium]|nr:heavy-metal-associated domain-containing protein [Clostridia bacterium]